MKKENQGVKIIDSIAEYHRLLQLPKPLHPLLSIIELHGDITYRGIPDNKLIHEFYSVFIKKNCKGRLGYGCTFYDFSEGIMSFAAPRQVFTFDPDSDLSGITGWSLVFHPDFIRGYPLGKQIKQYGFFAYQVHEALHISEKEDAMVDGIFRNIRQEYDSPIDTYSQDVMVAHIELLLNYSNRFYNRQFLTRKAVNNDILARLESLLADHFGGNGLRQNGLPTVQAVAAQMNLSPTYLSDMLRNLTGQNTQQHIHNQLIEKAKEMLTTTSLSVSEVAFRMGFEYPQSFSKLFKSKTQVTPLEFRQSFN